MTKKKNKTVNLYSKDEKANNILNQYQDQEVNISNRFISLLKIVEDIKEYEFDFYEIVESDNNSFIKLCCTNLKNCIVVFCPKSTDKNDINIIEVIGKDRAHYYDLSLFKKLEINPDNIDLLETGDLKNFKFGRLISDNYSFFNILLGEGRSYRINAISEGLSLINDKLIKELNRLEQRPTAHDIVLVLEKIIDDNKLTFEFESVVVYDNGCKINELKAAYENVSGVSR